MKTGGWGIGLRLYVEEVVERGVLGFVCDVDEGDAVTWLAVG
jgi:hypothetical protein